MKSNEIENIQESPSKKITEPLKILKNNTNTQEFNDKVCIYFLAEKQSKSGLLFNERFFLLYDLEFFGYTSKFSSKLQIPFHYFEEIPAMKQKIDLTDVLQLQVKSNFLIIRFMKKVKDKKVEDFWRLKFSTTAIFNDVLQKLKETIAMRRNLPQRDMKTPIKAEIGMQISNKLGVTQEKEKVNKSNVSQNEKDLNRSLEFEDEKQIKNPTKSQYENPLKENELTRNLTFQEYAVRETSNQMGQRLQRIEQVSPIKTNESIHVKIINEENKSEKGYFQRYMQQEKKKYESNIKILSDQNLQWTYQFLKGSEENVVIKFKEFSEALVTNIIDQLSINERKRIYTPVSNTIDSSIYEIEGLMIRLCFSMPKQLKLLHFAKQTVVSENEIKKANSQFKNLNYILQLTRNQGRIRVPLAMMVEYKGIVAFVKAKYTEDNQLNSNISSQLINLSKLSKIQKMIFEDPESIKINPLNNKTYQRLHRETQSQNKSRLNFDFFMLDDIKHFLPQDFLFRDKYPEYKFLRQELVQNSKDQQFTGENLQSYLNKSKIPKNVQQSITELQELSQMVITNIQLLLNEWQNLDEIVLNSIEIQNLLHKYGINIRYLGVICQKTRVPLIRKICMTEITARVAKILLRYDLQQNIRNNVKQQYQMNNFNQDKFQNIVKNTDELIKMAIQFLNSITTQNQKSEAVWRSLNKQSLYSFNIALNKQDLYQGPFLVALVYHCNLDINWEKFDFDNKMLRKRNLFSREMFRGFLVRSKIYNLNFTDLYKRVNDNLEQQNEQNVEQIKSLLNLRKFQIPDHFRQNNTYEKIALYIASYVQPKNQNSNTLPCSNIYTNDPSLPPNIFMIKIAILEIKWAFKYNDHEKGIKLSEYLLNRIKKWYGDLNPIYTELYDLLSQYHLNKRNYDEAILFSKNSLNNCSKLIGNNHQKTAQCYYHLAEIYFKASRKTEAYTNYKKGKNILENEEKSQGIPFAFICLKIALLELNIGAKTEVISNILKSIQILQRANENGSYEDELVNAYELLSRAYQANDNKAQYKKLSLFCGDKLFQMKSNENLEKLLKIVMLEYFDELNAKSSQNMIMLLESIPRNYNSASYINACNFLRKFIGKFGNFNSKINQFFSNFDQIFLYIKNNAIISRWKGLQSDIKTPAQQFIGFLQSLIYFLGEGFVYGAIKE